MIYLFDNAKKLFGEVPEGDLLSYDQKLVLGGPITVTASAVYHSDIEAAHYFGSKDIDNENEFLMYRITSLTEESGKIFLTGIYLMHDELQGEVVRDKRPTNQTPAAALGSILDGSAWQVGAAQTTGTASGSYYYQSRLSALYDFAKKWNVEFKPRMTFSNGIITGRYIDLYDQISTDYGKRYEYGDNLIHVVAEQANEGIYTALIGRGKGEETESGGFGRRITFEDVEWSVANGDPVDKPLGQDYVSLPSAVATYGYREAVVEFTDTEDKEQLLRETYTELVHRSRPKVEFKSDVIETGRVELGETVSVIRDDIGVRYKTRVFELDRNFLNKKIKSFRFGDRIYASAAERIKEENKKVEEKLRENQSIMYEALAKITDSYWNEDGYNYELKADNEYNLPAGYYSFDRPIDQSPTKVVYVGAGKVLIADSKNAADEWEWRTALTPEGLVGSEIIAHSITANKLSSDVGQNLDLSSNNSVRTIINSIGGVNLARYTNTDQWGVYGSGNVEIRPTGEIRYTKTTTGTGGAHQIGKGRLMELEEGKTYTLSFKTRGAAALELDYVHIMHTEGANQKVELNTTRSTSYTAWQDRKATFTKTGTSPTSYVLIGTTMGDSLFFEIKDVQVESGPFATSWSVHPEEFLTRTIKADMDGLTVGRSDLEVTTNIKEDGLRIRDGSKDVASFVYGMASIPKLYSDMIRGDVVNTHSGGTYTVGDGQSYTTMSEFLAVMGTRKHLLSDLTIEIKDSISGDIVIEGFSGAPMYINFKLGASLAGNILIKNNSCMVYVQGISTRHIIQGQIRSDSSLFTYIDNMIIDPINTAVDGVVASHGARMQVRGCDISRCRYGILAQHGAEVTALDNLGAPSDGGYVVYMGGVIYGKGTMPSHATKFSGATGFWHDQGTTTAGTQHFPPGAIPKLFTQTFMPKSLRTWSYQYGAYSSSYPGQAAQNRWDSDTGYFEGHIAFGGEVRDYINDRNGDDGLKVELQVSRYSGTNGSWDGVSPDNQFAITGGSFGAVLKGASSGWVTISPTLIPTSGYIFKFGSQSTGSKYAAWDGAKIRVTKTKNI